MIYRSIVVTLLLSTAIANTAESRSQQTTKYAVLAIEYIGESDKPITPIVISTSKSGVDWYRTTVLKRSQWDLSYTHVVGSSLLQKLVADVQTVKGTVRQNEQVPSVSEILSVAVVTPEKSDRFLYRTDLAVSLLERLQGSCDNEESLHLDLVHFEDRIRPRK